MKRTELGDYLHSVIAGNTQELHEYRQQVDIRNQIELGGYIHGKPCQTQAANHLQREIDKLNLERKITG